MLDALIRDKRLLICVGPGGVGKTTMAAAIGAAAAAGGKRTLVCTIDPAPRLADALGVATLGGEPVDLGASAYAQLGIAAPGGLFAARIDTEQAFRRLVEATVKDRVVSERILHNPIYLEITTRLTGSGEMAATLALHELLQREAFELIVLDTPPTAHALDFLAAPRRIADAVCSPTLLAFMQTPPTGGRLSLSRLRSAGPLMLRRFARIVGSQFLDDVAAFLADFRPVLAGCRERALAVEAILRQPTAGCFVVLAPERAAVAEALFLAERMVAAGVSTDAFIVNRVANRPALLSEAELLRRLGGLPVATAMTPENLAGAARGVAVAIETLAVMAAAHEAAIAELQTRMATRATEAKGQRVPLLRVPLLADDAATLADVRRIGEKLRATLPA